MTDRSLPEHDAEIGSDGGPTRIYSQTARMFHWITVLLVLPMIPVGYIMSDDVSPFKISEAVQSQLYSAHKLVGFVLLWLTVARLIYRFTHGAPASEPTLTAWQKGSSHATHWLLYGLLIVMSLSGWIGVSFFAAISRDVFGLFSLPAVTPIDPKMSVTVFVYHYYGALALIGLGCLHIGAALYHQLVRHDAVFASMWPVHLRRSRADDAQV